ncbi:SEC-C domain-containing protein [Sorangium sp. So ce861]|uniref:SEC-C domain-containing protein n=1 Tax=Sorangium sp. So ce861 TaxID=3133323 RepID=UPI003F5E7695
MDPIYFVVAAVVAVAVYFLFVDKRAAPKEAPVRGDSARRTKRPAQAAAKRGRVQPIGDEDEEEEEERRASTARDEPKLDEEQAPGAPRSDGPGAAGGEEADLHDPPCPCGSGAPFSRCHGADGSNAPERPPREQPRPTAPAKGAERTSFHYSGKTILSYEPSHGNQITYYDRNGRWYLWYPGNRGVVVGEWRVEGQLYWQRSITNSYNPVTKEYGGKWQSRPLQVKTKTFVDSAPGDVFGLATGRLPYRLPAHPQYRSVYEVKTRPRNE